MFAFKFKTMDFKQLHWLAKVWTFPASLAVLAFLIVSLVGIIIVKFLVWIKLLDAFEYWFYKVRRDLTKMSKDVREARKERA